MWFVFDFDDVKRNTESMSTEHQQKRNDDRCSLQALAPTYEGCYIRKRITHLRCFGPNLCALRVSH